MKTEKQKVIEKWKPVMDKLGIPIQSIENTKLPIAIKLPIVNKNKK